MMKNKSTKTHLTETKCSSLIDRKKRLQRIKDAAARNKMKNQWVGEVVDEPTTYSKAEEKVTDLLSSRIKDELTLQGSID
jgi:hypothetical protein